MMNLIQLVLIFTLTSFFSAPAFAQPNSSELEVVVNTTKNFSQSDLEKLHQATVMVQEIVNTTEFKDRVINFVYQNQKTFVQNNGLSNEQIYSLLMSGAKKYPVATPANHVMDFDLELFKPKLFQGNVLGYTSSSTSLISINQKFYRSSAVYEVAMNLVHEWTHKMGFEHDFNYTARRDYSVPYAVGYMIRDIGKLMSGK